MLRIGLSWGFKYDNGSTIFTTPLLPVPASSLFSPHFLFPPILPSPLRFTKPLYGETLSTPLTLEFYGLQSTFTYNLLGPHYNLGFGRVGMTPIL